MFDGCGDEGGADFCGGGGGGLCGGVYGGGVGVGLVVVKRRTNTIFTITTTNITNNITDHMTESF